MCAGTEVVIAGLWCVRVLICAETEIMAGSAQVSVAEDNDLVNVQIVSNKAENTSLLFTNVEWNVKLELSRCEWWLDLVGITTCFCS